MSAAIAAPNPTLYVLPFNAVGRGSIGLAGGKALNLAELARAGFPVPPGFLVAATAYALAADASGVARLFPELSATPPDSTQRLAELAAEARAAILATDVAAEIAGPIAEAYAALGTDIAVAVRSSATAEDLPFASFAGQQDTYLNIKGLPAVLDAVRRCWASLFTDRAVAYRAKNGIAPQSVRIAVVIQRMVEATTAAVLFTANPLTGRRRQAVIDASPGLGEAIVSGAVNPDHYVVDSATGQILERRIGERRGAAPTTAAREGPNGEPAAKGGACLSDEAVRELALLGARVEAHYGAPQDIELAFDAEGKVWLTQARPITTLFPLPEGAPTSDADLRVYFSGTADEGVTRPITPMGMQAFRLCGSAWADRLWGSRKFDRSRGPAWFREAAHRMYYDITPLLRSSLARRALDALLPSFDQHSAAIVRALASDPRFTPQKTPLRTVARAALTPLARGRVLSLMALCLASPERGRALGRPELEAAIALADVPPGATPLDRLNRAEELLFDGLGALPRTLMAPLAGGTALLVAQGLLGPRATRDEVQIALRGLPHNPTTEMNLALWDIARQARQSAEAVSALEREAPEELSARYRDGSLPAPLGEALGRFLARYGRRGVAEIDMGLPRWSEDPSYLFGMLRNYLRIEGEAAAPDAQFRRSREEGIAMAAELGARAAFVRGALVRFFLGRARELTGTREAGKDDLTWLFEAARGLLWPVGEALAQSGRLDAAEDIWFLSIAEARTGLAGADLRPLARARRESYARELGRKRVPAIFLSDGTEPVVDEDRSAADDGSGALAGTGASPGKARGRARVLVEPAGARIEPGEVLVAPSTDPGWTPLFLTAGGLVMEKGGVMSHGAVVAREYGIPAVVGVSGATSRIASGQEIEIDGSSGRVTIL
jgi:phosphohistidine swiveling domain-containing protein